VQLEALGQSVEESVPDAEGVPLGEGVGVAPATPREEPVPELVVDRLGLWDTLLVEQGEEEWEGLREARPVLVMEGVEVAHREGLRVALPHGLEEGVRLGVGLSEALTEALGVRVGESVPEREPQRVGSTEVEPEAVGCPDRVGEPEARDVEEGQLDRLSEASREREEEGQLDRLTEASREREEEGQEVALPEALPAATPPLAVLAREPVADSEGEVETLGDGVERAEAEWLEETEGLEDIGCGCVVTRRLQMRSREK
jgi:hypothetical protein